MLALACKELTGSFDRVVALEVTGTLTPRVEEQDSLRLAARALDAAGAEIADVEIFWAVIDTGAVAFDLDSVTGWITARTPGSNRVQARVGTLRSGPITVTVTAAPDTVSAPGDTRIEVPAGAVTSAGLLTLVEDLTTAPGQRVVLGGKTVTYEVIDPTPGTPQSAGFFLTPADTVPGPDPHRVSVSTTGNGQAAVFVRKVAGATIPDSVTVDAVALTALGAQVPGSPVRFIVVFLAN